MADNREQIRFEIIFNTRAALYEIAAMSNSADNFEQIITRFGNYLIQSSKKWGVPIKDLQRDFMNLDETMKAAGEKGGLPEGLFPGQNAKEVFDFRMHTYALPKHQIYFFCSEGCLKRFRRSGSN